MFRKLGRLVTANPWKVVLIWVIAVAVIVPFSPSLADVTNEDQTSFLPSSDESSARRSSPRALPDASGATARFVLKREDGAVLAADRSEVSREFAAALERPRSSVNSVETGPEQLAENETRSARPGRVRGDAADEPVKDAVKELRRRGGGCSPAAASRPALTGDAAQRRHGGVVRQRRDDHLRRHLRADPAPRRRHLPQPDRRLPADRDHRARVPARDLAGRAARRHLRLRGRRLAHLAADRRAVRDRHRLHPLPALPLPRTTAGRRRVARGGRLLRPPCR